MDVDFDLLALRGLAGECGADVPAMRAGRSGSVTREARVDAVEDARDVLDDGERGIAAGPARCNGVGAGDVQSCT